MRQGWRLKTIADLCTVIAGQSPKGENYNSKGDGLPFYQGKKEFGCKFLRPPSVWTTQVTKEAMARDILMSVRAPVGPINFSTEQVCIGRGLAAIRAGEEIDRDFLFYALLERQPEIAGNEGAVFASINKKQIEAIEIPLPPLPEQRRIVAILDEAFQGIDRAVANTEKNLANARELFESYLDAVLSESGDDWEETKIGVVCPRLEYGTSIKSQPQGDVPVLRMGNLQGGSIDWSNLVFTSDPQEISRYMLHRDDVLFNRTNSEEHVGKTSIFDGSRPAIFAGYLIRVHRDTDKVDAHYLNFYLNSCRAREYGRSVMGRSVNQANISASKLANYPLPLAPMPEQLKITKKLRLLAELSSSLETAARRKLDLLAGLEQSILHKAFAGELTAGEPDRVLAEAGA